MEKTPKKALAVYNVLCAEPGDPLIKCIWFSGDEAEAAARLDAHQTAGDIVVNTPAESDWQTLLVTVKAPDTEIQCELEVGANFVIYDNNTIGVLYNVDLTAEQAAALFA